MPLHGALTFKFDYKGDGYFRCEYTFYAEIAEPSGDIKFSIVGNMFDDGSNKTQGSNTSAAYIIKNDIGTLSFSLDLDNSGGGYHNGPAQFTGTAYNFVQQ